MRRLVVAAVAATVLSAPAAALADGGYKAEIRRTTGGWAHVKAANHGSLGYGYGYAYAQDQACTLADMVVTLRAERTRWFGPQDGNLESDFFWQRIEDEGTVGELSRRDPPHGPSRVVRATVRGFAAGFNAFLRERGVRDPRCRGERWVRPITAKDLYRRFYQLGLRASSGNFLDEIVAAQPPAAAGAAAASAPAAPDPNAFADRLGPAGLGSNAYAIGRRGARGGARSLLLGNPHFPWDGAERWYEVHLTIPGKLNVIGAALQGAPVVNIGFTRGVAWSHTVSTARRFTPYELDLVPGRPTQYVVDGRPERMRTRTVRVAGREHTFYTTRWGPVFDFPGAGLSWTAEHAYAFADVNADQFRLTNQWEQFDRAQSVGDLRRAYRRVQGNPWVNTIAADSKGRAYYADESVVPNVDAELQRRCSDSPIAPLLLTQGVVLLDGSRSACAWKGGNRVASGILPPRELPRVTRTDYVANSNDSYWLPNSRIRLRGFPRIMGAERTPRLLRTRLALTQADQRLAGTDGLGRPGFTLGTLQRVMFGNRNLSAELARDATVAACRASGRPDLAQACDVLAAWDTRADVGSRGAVLWREHWARLAGAAAWTVPYDPDDPVDTPRGLDPASPAVLTALTGAVEDLRAKGIALDTPLGALQAEPRGDRRIPIHGCSESEGCFNIITTRRDEQGRYDPYTGASFVMAAEFDRRGRPRGRALLSYSQSENPRSEHYDDQTRRFSRKRWLPMRFTERQIRRDPQYERTVVRQRR